MRFMFRAIFLIMGAIYMCSFFGCSDGIKYEKYTCDDANLNISVDYVLGWKHSKQVGSYGSFTQVVFYEPEMKNKSLKALMVITAEKGSKVAFKPLTLEGMENDILKKRGFFKGMKVASRSKMRILGAEAIELVLAYMASDKLYSIDAKLVPVKERIVIVKPGDIFYTIRYENTEKDFDTYNREFTHCFKSLKIR